MALNASLPPLPPPLSPPRRLARASSLASASPLLMHVLVLADVRTWLARSSPFPGTCSLFARLLTPATDATVLQLLARGSSTPLQMSCLSPHLPHHPLRFWESQWPRTSSLISSLRQSLSPPRLPCLPACIGRPAGNPNCSTSALNSPAHLTMADASLAMITAE